jgi:hypothetical protein
MKRDVEKYCHQRTGLGCSTGNSLPSAPATDARYYFEVEVKYKSSKMFVQPEQKQH